MMSSILVSKQENAIHITLNRPEALNALNHEMVLEVTRLLKLYEYDNNIDEIIFKGSGDKAFCAGGDVKSVYYLGLENEKMAFQYFYDEYEMNKIIHTYPKQITSICHGYVMGGGYGIAGNGAHIIVDDTTRFAMPETAIGFFPDVGIGWKLSRAGALGMYIALTGSIFNADMMIAAGLATEKKGPISTVENINNIKHHFSKESLEDIWFSLENDKSPFARETLDTLKTRSPMSLHVTFHHLKMAEKQGFEQSIKRDYCLACAFFTKPDIYEGIRAQLIDKDKLPKWEHSSIFNISRVDIDYYLQFGDDSCHKYIF